MSQGIKASNRIGENIAKARKSKKLTQEQFATRLQGKFILECKYNFGY